MSSQSYISAYLKLKQCVSYISVNLGKNKYKEKKTHGSEAETTWGDALNSTLNKISG